MNRDDSDLVWSSDQGDLRKNPEPARPSGPGRPRSKKNRRNEPAPKVQPGTRLKVKRELAGRRGKAVTTISDINMSDAELKDLAGMLKKKCGVGGTAKNGRNENQGDHRDKVIALLKAAGHDAVAAGG